MQVKYGVNLRCHPAPPTEDNHDDGQGQGHFRVSRHRADGVARRARATRGQHRAGGKGRRRRGGARGCRHVATARPAPGRRAGRARGGHPPEAARRGGAGRRRRLPARSAGASMSEERGSGDWLLGGLVSAAAADGCGAVAYAGERLATALVGFLFVTVLFLASLCLLTLPADRSLAAALGEIYASLIVGCIYLFAGLVL